MRNKYFILLIGLSMIFSSCDDFLSTLPDNRTIINSPEKASELLVSAYPGSNILFYLEAMTDNVTDRGVNLRPEIDSYCMQMNQSAFKWDDLSLDMQDTPSYFWSASYAAIAAANHVLDAIRKAGDTEEYQAQKGEALITRAYNHFMLVNIFAQHYDPATAETDLGIDYVTEPEVVIMGAYQRLSVKEVYDRIGKDIEAAFPLEGTVLIKDAAYGSTPKYHFTKAAAAAFASKYYLYIGDWDKAEKYADIALGSSPVLRDWNNYSSISPQVRQRRYTSVEEPANLLLASTLTWANWYSQAYLRYGYSIAIDNELFSGKSFVNADWSYRTESYQVSSESKTFLKWWGYFKADGINANNGNYYLMQPLFTTDEVMTYRIEARAMKGQYGLACEDITTFLKTKTSGFNGSVNLNMVKSYYSTQPDLDPYYRKEMDDDKMQLVKCAVDLRRHDQVQEGSRWFDIKRFQIVVTHSEYQTGNTDVLVKRDFRRALQIPADAISYGLTPNPR